MDIYLQIGLVASSGRKANYRADEDIVVIDA